MYNIGHRRTNPFHLSEYKIYSFLEQFKKEFLRIMAYGAKLLKVC